MTNASENHRLFSDRFWIVAAIVTGTVGISETLMAQAAREPISSTTSATDTMPPEPQAAPHEGPALAETDTFAQSHWHSGMAYLEEGEYAKALEAFTKAYELSERPSLLRSIAVAHEKLGDLASALGTIDLYLRQVPDAADIDDVRRYRSELQSRYDHDQSQLSEGTPPQPAEPKHVAVRTTDPLAYVLPQPEGSPDPREAESSNGRDIVIWSALGVSLAAAAGAVVTGSSASSRFDDLEDTCARMCTREDTHAGRTLAVTSTVLSGLAVVAAGTAIWAWLDAPHAGANSRPSQQAARTPRFAVGYAGKQFMSRANWSF
jgi:tetratricopeptide (TPR) repeat protein